MPRRRITASELQFRSLVRQPITGADPNWRAGSRDDTSVESRPYAIMAQRRPADMSRWARQPVMTQGPTHAAGLFCLGFLIEFRSSHWRSRVESSRLDPGSSGIST